jgi:hypothetical protein
LVTARWNKSKYYNNFKEYEFDAVNWSGDVIKYFNSIDDTVATFVPDFGTGIQVKVFDKSKNDAAGVFSAIYNWSDPNPARYSTFIPNRNANRYYCYEINLDSYDMTTGLSTGKVQVPYSYVGYATVSCSPSGSNVWIYNNGVFSKVDPTNLAASSSINVSTIIGPAPAYVEGMGISDQGTLLFVNGGYIISYNLNTNSQTASPYSIPYYSYNNTYTFSFSADGQYFIIQRYGGTLMEFSSNTISSIGAYDAVVFDELNSSQFLVYDHTQNSLYIKDLNTKSVLQQYTASKSYSFFTLAGIDPITKWVLIQTNNSRIIVYDFIADKEIFNAANAAPNAVLYNGTLYSGNGARLKLN